MKRNVSGSAHNDESYNCWKKNSPLLYDSLYNHNMVWPSLCVAWGDNIPLVPAEGDRRRSSHASSSSSSAAASSSSSTTTATTTTNNPDKDEQTHSTLQALYFSSRTDATFNFETKRWKGAPNFLCAATVDLPHVRHTNYRGVGKFQEAYKSSHINIMKRIVHPGEVNKIRLCPHSSDLLATHSDSPLTYIWNVKTQPSRGSQADLIASVPDLVLEGHTAMSEYALAWNKQVPRLVSGGSDHMVVLWDLGDAATTLFNTKSNSKSPVKWKNQKTLQANRIFEGHTDTVEDVTFHPTGHGNIFCSVGDDRGLIIWDARVDNPIAIRVNNAHQEDINCVDWNNHDPTSIISGSSDGKCLAVGWWGCFFIRGKKLISLFILYCPLCIISLCSFLGSFFPSLSFLLVTNIKMAHRYHTPIRLPHVF
jgi:histone-binding protein RBBP4